MIYSTNSRQGLTLNAAEPTKGGRPRLEAPSIAHIKDVVMRPIAKMQLRSFELWRGPALTLLVCASMLALGSARLQAKPPQGASKPEASKTAGAVNQVARDKSGDLADRPAAVGPGDRLSFEQEKVAAEMTELEERMFRLSASLRKLEPENSSRLMMGLKYAREQLILHQMREAKEVLHKLKLGDAVASQKDLLVKLEKLEHLLLSPDLDLQLQLEQVRAMRDALKRLDTVIKEEEREKRASEELAATKRKLDGLKKREASLENLVERQTKHVDDAEALAKDPKAAAKDAKDGAKEAKDGDKDAKTGADQKAPLAQLGSDQQKTQQDTQGLAKAQSPAPAEKSLNEAGDKMADAVASLGKDELGKAQPSMKDALELLKKELAATKTERMQQEVKLAKERFEALKKEQAGNREATEATSELVRGLGEKGAGALAELAKAGSSMSSAEGKLGKMSAGEAGEDQGRALASLRYAKDQLEDQLAQLLNELRGEVKRKVLDSLQAMYEKQVQVRQATVTQGKKAKAGSRLALSAVVALSKEEAKIIAVADEAIGLVEETEFGIALPAALTAVRDSMDDVRISLEKGNAAREVVNAEQQVEADLLALIGAMKQLPSDKPGKEEEGKGGGGGEMEEERELNRLVAELKLVRLLQVKVNRGTQEVDITRPKDEKVIPVAVRNRVEELTGRQEDIRDVTERLATERDVRGQ